jgi:glycosyltransferase involved in cell wall biosynthesis
MKAPQSRSPKLRVAIVAPSLRYVGGQAVQADLLTRLWKSDSEVELKFLPVDPPLPRVFAWAECIPFVRTFLREPLYFWHLWFGLRDVDIAHIFSASYWSFLLAPIPAWLLAKLRGTKTIINYRSGEARDHLQRFRSGRLALSRVDKIVVPSEYLVHVFREFGLKSIVVPNLIDLSQIRFRERKPLRPHLICTRGFSEYYCVDVVVKAFAEVKKQYPEAELDLVGGGPLEADIRKQVELLNLSGVRFLGVSSRQQIGEYYDRADIFINASRLDNMPVSVIEAFGVGTPVVTTSPESMPYLVQHERTGLLSPVGDEKSLAANVIRLLRDPELAQNLAENAHTQSLQYTWGVVRGQWLQVYRDLVQTHER